SDQAAALAAAVPAAGSHGAGKVIAGGGADDPPRRFTAAHERQRHVAVQPALATRPDTGLGIAAVAGCAGGDRSLVTGGMAQARRLSLPSSSATAVSAAIPAARRTRRPSAATIP